LIKNIIAKRYSLALVEVFPDGELTALEKEVNSFIRFLEENPRIEEFFISPIVKNEDKKDILNKLSDGIKINKKFHNLLKILVDRDRMHFLREICRGIIKQIHQRLNIKDFELVTAHKIDTKRIEKIRNFVSQYVSGKVDVTHRIDKRIKGGFVAYNENLAIDASIKNNLINFRREF
jgi:F-type H+-transporting ATPase subunit delta